MLKDKLTCLIFSCDKFSDIWDGNLKLFDQNWHDHNFDTYIVTDKETDYSHPGIKIIAAGKDVEWTDRLKIALKFVKTEYVFFTLDDYFLIKPVNNENIERLVSLMESDGYDYIRLFPNPKRATSEPVAGYPGLYHINTDYNYSVNLYSGIWRKKFFEFTVKQPINVWKFEVSLYEKAKEYGARCLVDYNKDYVILDVIRKGKILHSANRYFKKHLGIYEGNREIQSWQYEFKLWIKTMVARYSPDFMVKPLRAIYVKLGGKSFVQQQ